MFSSYSYFPCPLLRCISPCGARSLNRLILVFVEASQVGKAPSTSVLATIVVPGLRVCNVARVTNYLISRGRMLQYAVPVGSRNLFFRVALHYVTGTQRGVLQRMGNNKLAASVTREERGALLPSACPILFSSSPLQVVTLLDNRGPGKPLVALAEP